MGYIECTKLYQSTEKLSKLDVRIVWIYRKIEYLELRKFNVKLCTLYAWIFWICRKIELRKNIECTKLRKSNRK